MNLTEVLGVILSSLKEIVTFNTASVQELKNDKFEIIYCDGFDKPEDVVGLRFACDEGTLNKQVLDKKTTVVISDVRDYKEFVDRTKGKKIRSFMAVPLAINDKIIGELSLCSFELDYYNAETAALAEAFAAQAAVALNNAINFKELGSAKAAVEEAAKAKGDFLANMSHEIRTPMNAIMGLLSLLSYTNLTPKQNDYVKKIDNASKSLLYIINDILDFSKIESGKLSVEKIEFKLDEVLSHLSDVLSLKAEAKGIEFIISKGELVPDGLIGDPLRLEQILLNLTNNAIKFTDQGEIIVKIIAEKQDKNEVLMRFSVIDSGIGMTEEQMTGLFSAFVQADASTTRKYGGTGLGLSISKNLVELMGGQIDAVSEYGKGSEFFFTCPFKLSMHPAECKTCIPVEVSGLDVMVVEDNAYARDVIDNYLKRFGLNVALVSCGEEALNEAVKYHFDLFIIDYKMPGINGVETWTKIKETSRINKQSKAILISSYSKYEILEEAKQAEFTDILAKPLTQSILFDAIVNAFSSKEAVSGQTKTETQYPKDFEKIKGARILVVEDNEINQQVVKEILEMQGFFVELADNGKACVDRLSAGETYDLVFMDLQMPIMDGYTAARVLREKQGLKLPIIALSADAMDEMVEAAKKAGMNGYVRKPIDIQVLFEVMAQHIKPKVRKRKPEKNSKLSPGLEVVAKKMLRNIDVDNGLGRFGGNTELYLSTLNKFVKNNQDFVLVLRGLVVQRKIQESKRMLHTMKGVSGNIGAVRLSRAVIECEQVISKDTFSEKAAYIKLNEIDNELSAIFSQIDKLNNTSEVVSLTVSGTEMIDDSEMIKRLKALQGLLKQYDTAAKEAFNAMKTVAFGIDEGRFNTMGEYIDNYDFDSATRLCGELIKEFKKRVSTK